MTGPAAASPGLIDYHAMRLLRFRRALRDFLRRWGLYLLVAAALFGAGSNAPLTAAAAAASLLLWPLRAAAERDWLIVPATLAYALVGTLPVVLTRPLWWPRHWSDAERALPLPQETIRRSDRFFGALVMLPWQALLLAGWIAIGLNEGWASDVLHRGLAIGGWIAAAAGSLFLSWRWMRFVRRPSRQAVDRTERRRSAVRREPLTRRLDARRALVLLPLLRGRAPASAALLAAGLIATVGCALLATWTSLAIGWALALLAVAALSATSLLRARTTRELRPLWRETSSLPVDVDACERARWALVLMPVVGSVVVLLAACAGSSTIRPHVLASYACALVAGCAIESGTPMETTHHAARWILILAVAIAFGSEVAAS